MIHLASLALLATPKPVTVCAVGDVMLARGVGRQIERAGAPSLLKRARPLLHGDIVLGNLECCLCDKPLVTKHRHRLRASPWSVQALEGFTHLTLANNHAEDCGAAGLLDTVQCLEKAGIGWADCRNPAVAVDKRFTLLAFDAAKSPAAEMARQVRAATTPIVIVSIHWGIEYDHHPTPAQRKLASELAAAGADLIVGHGPHVLQPVERLGESLVAYSLGNFVFDDCRPGPSLTAVLRCLLAPDGPREVRLIPMKIERCSPRPVGGRESKLVRKHLELDPFGRPKHRAIPRRRQG